MLVDLEREFTSVLSDRNRLIIGIDGLSRSGKTTIVKKIAGFLEDSHLSCQVIHLDDHIVERTKRYGTGSAEWQEYYFLQWEVELLKEAMFKKLSQSDELTLPYYDDKWDQQVYRELNLTGKKVVIVEGIFLQREEWEGYLDYTIFIDCPRNVRFERESAKTRRNIEKFLNRYWKAEDYYLKMVNPTGKADKVITCHELMDVAFFAEGDRK
ncbi:kinase [Mesobacillus jeotgali]|uniref:kinase n=1 Tax=Mesobacillus jeotgali TaxID=129985 RepID=UPI0027D459BA|nr:kinase [Mesobacillus jeotgali]